MKQVFNPYLPLYEYVPDGRDYLYYCFNFVPEIGVAVSDSPTGPFEFYGHVKYSEKQVMNYVMLPVIIIL